MGRTVERMPSRVRAVVQGDAGPLEIAAVVAVAILVWFLALGWDWSLVPGAGRGPSSAPQSGADWIVLGVVAMIGVCWLALRGRAVVGIVAVCVPIIFCSGWRLAAAGVVGWPTELAALIFALSAVCMATAGIGAWIRHRDALRHR